MKGPTATKHFKEYLVLWTGRRQVEAYAKCFRFAKSLSGKPQLDRFKQLADAVVKSQSLQEAIAQGLVPAPPDDNPSEGSVARAHRYQTQKKRKEEEENKRKRSEFDEKTEQGKEEFEKGMKRRREEMDKEEQ